MLNKEIDGKYQRAKAYTEVLGLMKYMDRENITKLPKELINFLEEHAASDYPFEFDPFEDIASQLSREALAIFAWIAVNFYPEAYNHDEMSEYNKNEEKYRTKQWIAIRERLLSVIHCEEIVQRIIETKKLKHFSEVYTILKMLPSKVQSRLQIENLMWIKLQREKIFDNNTEIKPDELSIETLGLLKYVLKDLHNIC